MHNDDFDLDLSQFDYLDNPDLIEEKDEFADALDDLRQKTVDEDDADLYEDDSDSFLDQMQDEDDGVEMESDGSVGRFAIGSWLSGWSRMQKMLLVGILIMYVLVLIIGAMIFLGVV